MNTNLPTGVVRAGAFPQTANLPDAVVELANQALDPMYDAPNPADQGVLLSGAAAGNLPAFSPYPQSSYADGGMVGTGGQPVRPAGLVPQGEGGITPELMQQEVQRIIQQHPQEVMRIRDNVMQALQSGDLTPQELNMIGQLAMAAAQNPEVYPQVRQFAIQQGLATERDIPPTYDQGLVFTLLLVVQAAQAQLGGQPMAGAGAQPQSAGQSPVGNFADGGALPDNSHNPDGSIKINAHEGEYVGTKAFRDWFGMKHISKMEQEAQEALRGNGQR